MARAAQGITLAAAAAVIGGLAWWMLKSPAGPDSPDGGDSPPAAVPEGPGRGPVKSPERGPAPSRPVGALLAVVRGEGKPLAATLSAGPAGGEAVTAAGSAEDGAVRLAAAPAATKLAVSISSPGWRTVFLPDVEVPAGGEKDLGVLEMERALPATGRVLDPAGKPVAGATVGALSSGGMNRFDFRRIADLVLDEPDWKAKATTREDGTFVLDALGPGSWNLVASATGFSPSAERSVLLHPAGTAPAVDLVLQKGHSLLVKVTGPGDAPVAGAEAAAASTGNRAGLPVAMGPARGVTDAGGEARLSGVSPGRTAVAVRASEGRLVVRTVEVPAATSLTVRLEGAATLVVRVKTAEGAPVEGASVVAMLQSGAGGGDSGDALTAVTGVDGSVRWDRLPAGRLSFVMVDKDGFPPSTPSPEGGGMSGREDLKDGQTLEKEIVLKAGVTITGVVRRRPGDSPVPGAKVVATSGANFFGGQPLRATADAEGAYRLEGVAEGRATLTAYAEGLAPPEAWSAGGNPFQPREEGQALPEGVVLVAAGGGEVRKDLFLEDAGSVTGRVLGPGGDGVGGARVEVSSTQGINFRGFGMPGGGSDFLPGPVLTAPDGSFVVKGVPAGQNLVARAEAPNLIAASSAPFHVTAGGAATGIEIRLAEGGSLAGVVTAGAGTPVSGARVRASARANRPGGRIVPMNMPGGPGGLEAATGPDGAWRIPTVPPGTMTVTVEAEGFIDGVRGDLNVAAGVETRADVSLEAGRAIAGTVRDAAGAPVEGARVFARTVVGTPPEQAKFKNGTTDAAGAFRLAGLPAATFTLTISAPGNAQRTLPDVAAGNEAVDVRLLPAVRMSGKVVDLEGNPVAGARVSATSEGADGVNGSGRSGADGTFEIDALVAGSYRVTAQTFDRKYGRSETKGVSGDATGLVLTLPRALEIRGRVVGVDGGVPAERGFVSAADPSGAGPPGRARWEEDGTFVLTGLSEGTYTLRATVPGKFEGTASAAAGGTGVTLRLEAASATNPPRPPQPVGPPAPTPR